MRKLFQHLKEDASKLSVTARWTIILLCTLPAFTLIPLTLFVQAYEMQLYAQIHVVDLALKLANADQRPELIQTSAQMFQMHTYLVLVFAVSAFGALVGAAFMYPWLPKKPAVNSATTVGAA